MVTMEPEAMVSLDFFNDAGMSKPACPNLPLFESVRYASRPSSSISSMDAVNQDFGARSLVVA
jgi:hypothetical protein